MRSDDQMTDRDTWPQISRVMSVFKQMHSHTLQHMIPTMRIFRDNFKVKILPHSGKILSTFSDELCNLKSIPVNHVCNI